MQARETGENTRNHTRKMEKTTRKYKEEKKRNEGTNKLRRRNSRKKNNLRIRAAFVQDGGQQITSNGGSEVQSGQFPVGSN